MPKTIAEEGLSIIYFHQSRLCYSSSFLSQPCLSVVRLSPAVTILQIMP